MKISVITPVYNSGSLIAGMLDSMLAQTLDDIEVILVDDHGSDDSMAVARQHIASHPSAKSFVFADNGGNKGPGVARNTGLAMASGEYVAFVDSDDWVEPDFCSSLYNAASDYRADMAYGHISFDYDDGSREIKYNPVLESGAFDHKKKHHFLTHYKSYFTTFIYRREFLLENGITFPDTHSAEDSCFLACSLLSAARIAAADKPFYHYNIIRTTVSRRKDPERWRNRMKSFRTIRRYAKEKGLLDNYRFEVNWIVFKKGFLLAVRDFFQNL